MYQLYQTKNENDALKTLKSKQQKCTQTHVYIDSISSYFIYSYMLHSCDGKGNHVKQIHVWIGYKRYDKRVEICRYVRRCDVAWCSAIENVNHVSTINVDILIVVLVKS